MENTTSGLWKSNLPKKGWVYVDVKDTGKRATSCTWCGTLIRYVHSLEHSETGISTECGCICAENLTEDYVNPKQREKTLRGKQARIKTWVKSPKWKNPTPNLHTRSTPTKYIHLKLEFIPHRSEWQINVVKFTNFYPDIELGRIEGRKFYFFLSDAKAASLEAYEWAKTRL